MNLLQPFYYPENGICTIEELYFNSDGAHLEQEDNSCFFYMNKNDKVSTNTYFNYFASSKWLKYTIIDKFTVKLVLQGTFRIKLINSYLVDGKVQHDVVQVRNIYVKEKREILFQHIFGLDAFESMYYIEIEALANGCQFWGGGYYTTEDIVNDVHLGMVMCTYKREKFIERNLSMLQNMPSSIAKNIDFFIIDNAHTLTKELNNKNVHLIYNKNVGGAGGFTRGLIEILLKYEKITHVVFMDDDILLNVTTIRQTIFYLQYVRKEHVNIFIGGATLRLDKKNLQLESGAVWHNNFLYNLKSGLNLKKEKDLLVNNLEESKSYNSWVYLCMPRKELSLDNLPMPLFVRGDDMEYGKRLTKKLLTLNGIGVWHVPVHNKYSSFMNYYVTRNTLILNSLYDENFGKFAFIKMFLGRIGRELMYYRYDNVLLIMRAYIDYLKGIQFFLEKDGEELHQDIMKISHPLIDYASMERNNYPFLYSYLQNPQEYKEKKFFKLLRLATLNGYLLPNFLFKKNRLSYNIVEFTAARPIDFYRSKCVLQIDLTTQKGQMTTIKRKKLIVFGVKAIKIIAKILIKCNKVKDDYRKNSEKIRKYEFWKNYLNIDN